MIPNSRSRHEKKKKREKEKKTNIPEKRLFFNIICRSPIRTERNILHYRVAQQSINSKNKSGWQSFSFIGEREKLPGVPSVFPRYLLTKERKEKKKKKKGGGGGGDKMKKKRKKGGKNWKGERERENKEVWRERPRLSENIGRTRSSEIKEEKINPWSPRSGKLMRIKIQFRRRANLFPNVASSWLEETGSSCYCGGWVEGQWADL